MPIFHILVNGARHRVDVESDTPLLWVLRDSIGLTGTKYGCGIGSCGACTVHANGAPIASCTTPISVVGDRPIVTIEGLSADHTHPVQRAWIDEDVPQCGYCQPGQVMGAAALLREKPGATEQEIEAAMALHVCRCGTYARIRAAILRARGAP